MFKWIEGRQKSGYDKMLIAKAKRPFTFDSYILRFPEGSEVKPHVDPVYNGYKHYRMNIILKHAKVGGQFKIGSSIINWPRLKVFRPDILKHEVTKVERGTRYVLSIGWLRRNKVP